ncbi:non-ribosomal peptide synthetase [Palleronia aestuarii]|uniref:non-ribosomal peptide synthetase n=1 Tax=Palleronia aestuarii TaxID=568105 RepID=UPI001473B734|nr:non-ribosomal peptide synthetase [Palleronia aestuarii]
MRCDGTYRQYVAYLAALSIRCPVALVDGSAAGSGQAFPVTYDYSPGEDLLEIDEGVPPEIHADLAVLLSTSGSTGAAKSVRLSHANIRANAESIIAYLGITGDDKAAMSLPFQYSYGMSVVNSHLLAGAEIVLMPGSVSSPEFWETFKSRGCTSLAGVPHTFDLIEQSRVDTSGLKTLRMMTQAGGKMPPAAIEAWSARSRAEGWSFVVMYGQTEAAPRMAYLPPEEAQANPGCIGRAIPGGTLSVRNDAGDILPDGEEGELVYEGPNVMMGYASSAADLALGQGPGVLHTGDLARRQPNGLFAITGRQSRFVKLFGYRISLDELDAKVKRDGISAASIAIGEEIHVVAGIPSEDAARLADEIDRWLKFPRGTVRVHAVTDLPRNANGKIDGLGMRAVAEAGSASATPPVRPVGRDMTAAEIFRVHFPASDIDDDTSFIDLGGDSLNYLSVALDLEASVGDLPDGWENLPARDLDALSASRRSTVAVDMPTLVRALAIVAIVADHFQLFAYGGGGALSLFLVAGWAFGAFTLPSVLRSGSIAPIVTLGLRVGIFTALMGAANWALTGYGSWPATFFVSNWVGPDVPGGAWFVEVYLQCLLLISLPLLSPSVRSFFAMKGFTALAVTAACAALAAIALDSVLDTDHLYRRLPFLLGWVFLLGMVAQAARSSGQKMWVALIAASGIMGFYGIAVSPFFAVVTFAMIWSPKLRMPRPLAIPIRSVAAGSLAIYLTHFQFASALAKVGLTHPTVSVIGSVIGGVLVWRIYLRIDHLVTKALPVQSTRAAKDGLS